MSQPIKEVVEKNKNPLVLSEWRVDNSAVLASGESYLKGSVLSKDTNGNLELATDASKVEAVLLDDVDASKSNKNAPILVGGAVDKTRLVLGSDLSLATIEASLRNKNIYLK